MAKLLESDDYIIVNVLLLFLLINFDLQIGTIYIAMAVIDWVAYYIAIDRNAFTTIPLESNRKNRMMSLVWAMGSYVVFILAVNFLTIHQATFDLTNASSVIAGTFSATPILSGSKYIKLVVWGILIPIVETRFFFRTFLQWGMKAANISKPSLFTIKGLGVLAFFGAAFSVFHIVAKGITNNNSLLATFLFGVISVGLVLYFVEAIQAIFLHIITNTIATMQQLGMGLFEGAGITAMGVSIVAGVILVTWLLLFQEIPFISKTGG